ncbi:hypothetical protein [Massilia pseudoviolaceinigra]|uniref:hypothetical protein n=1 Tax=Massilia pseudoviolaceinigra TaxID=3057165 RepID=UPI002796CE5F|nr:hypothetical protein [Massilia sp. CCM 9206]MDQ1923463.1 hypothetical protein [Massilia sp. CCM 9206]
MSTFPSPVLAIRSSGLVTAIGNSTLQTTSSWLTQARRMRRVDLDGFADPFTIADCHSVTAQLAPVERLAALLFPAVAEAMDDADYLTQQLEDECMEIVVLPRWLNPADGKRLATELGAMLLRYKGWVDRPRSRLIVPAGASGAWLGLEYAYRSLATNPRLQHVMIAAVDSACTPELLQQAAAADWLHRPGNAEGYVPGEAAACVLLQRADSISELPAGDFALHRPAFFNADEHWGPCATKPDASPLSQALSGALAAAGMEPSNISHLESDMDGSDWRAHLESTALSRVIFSQTTALPQWRPATLLGQTGAAGGIIGWLLPASLHQQQIEHINTVLNWSISPSGEAAACVLERSPN